MALRLSPSVGVVIGREAVSVVANSSVVVKVICVAITIGYLVSFSSSAVLWLSVTPEYFFPPHFRLWTAITHCFLEVHVWQVLVDLVVIVLVGKLLEPLWGPFEMIVFFLIVNIGVAVVSAFFYYLLYIMTYNASHLFGVHIHGLAGYLAGVSVAVKQIMPDHVLYRSPIGKITNRNIPLLVFAICFVMWAITLVEGSFCTMFGSGLVISWCYLRFYQVHSNGSKGDLADSFAFHTFFPNVLQPPIAVVCNTIFAVLVKLRVCSRPVRKYDIGSATSSISISLPGVESHDTERRRQIALKALSERLSKVESGTTSAAQDGGAVETAWPSLDDDNAGKAGLESVHAPKEPQPKGPQPPATAEQQHGGQELNQAPASSEVRTATIVQIADETAETAAHQPES